MPQLSWETHALEVCAEPGGLVARPKCWTMDELAGGGQFRVYELPVTFGCDGSEYPSAHYPLPTTRTSLDAGAGR